MNTLEGNKLIAEFMGVSKGDNTHYDVEPFNLTEYKDVDDLKYDISWDWLMPVVEKIESILPDDSVVVIQYKDCIIPVNEGEFDIHASPTIGSNSKIESTYKAVVEFIKWYNENKEA